MFTVIKTVAVLNIGTMFTVIKAVAVLNLIKKGEISGSAEDDKGIRCHSN